MAPVNNLGDRRVAAAGSRKTKEKAIDLEKALGELERGDLPLDKALKKFEKGVALTRDCEAALTAAERKVELLMADADLDDTPKPFGDDED